MLVTNYLPNKGVIPRTTKFIQLKYFILLNLK